jgi:hypothetical protein|tara:strand:- start:1155 stop:1370 length:216 start_codon:yes stop_codon:yes gene_type:complete
MKSKNYILSQIRELLIERHAYTPERADRYVELHKDDKVYELLVLKKNLSEEENYPEISYRRSIWHHEYEDE